MSEEPDRCETAEERSSDTGSTPEVPHRKTVEELSARLRADVSNLREDPLRLERTSGVFLYLSIEEMKELNERMEDLIEKAQNYRE